MPAGGTPTVGGWIERPSAAPRAAVLLAHGAGAGPDSPFLSTFASELARRGCAVLRFEYPYWARARAEGRRRPPDRAPVLLAAQRAALDALREETPDTPLFLAGKSMGGRMASHLAAQGEAVRGCIVLGYPLHPAGRPEKAAERCAHFPAVVVPTLFVQGTRDPLAPLPALRERLAELGGPARLELVADADHDFELPRRAVAAPGGPIPDLARRVADWIGEVLAQAP